jgi:hypothetical protein
MSASFFLAVIDDEGEAATKRAAPRSLAAVREANSTKEAWNMSATDPSQW